MTQAEMVEVYSKKIRSSLDDLLDMAHVDELWDEDIAALKAIADALEGVVTGTVDAAKLREVITA